MKFSTTTGLKMGMDLTSKTYVVTGATSGIGLATADFLARLGAEVIGVGRSSEHCLEAEKILTSQTGNKHIKYFAADFCLQKDVRELSARITEYQTAIGKACLDGLVNNAGTFTYWMSLTPDGIETQWAVNHLAPFLLTQQLLPLLKSAPFARIVTVSSDSHYFSKIDWKDPQLNRHYNGLRAYGNTKLANILFTLELNRRLNHSSGVRAFAADPGLVKTDIGMKGTPGLVRWVWKIRRSGGTNPESPARGIVFLLTEPTIQNVAEIYWKGSQPKRSNRASLDIQSAGKLWELSSKMCGLVCEETHV